MKIDLTLRKKFENKMCIVHINFKYKYLHQVQICIKSTSELAVINNSYKQYHNM